MEEVEDDSLIFNWNNVTLETGDKAEIIYKETDCPSSLNAETTRMVGFGTKVSRRDKVINNLTVSN